MSLFIGASYASAARYPMDDPDVIDIGLCIIKHCGVYTEEYKNWIWHKNAVPPVVVLFGLLDDDQRAIAIGLHCHLLTEKRFFFQPLSKVIKSLIFIGLLCKGLWLCSNSSPQSSLQNLSQRSFDRGIKVVPWALLLRTILLITQREVDCQLNAARLR